jgi:hypothetical protein
MQGCNCQSTLDSAVGINKQKVTFSKTDKTDWQLELLSTLNVGHFVEGICSIDSKLDTKKIAILSIYFSCSANSKIQHILHVLI